MNDDDEVSPEQARDLLLHELDRARAADSLEHLIMHLETALIWSRGAVWP